MHGPPDSSRVAPFDRGDLCPGHTVLHARLARPRCVLPQRSTISRALSGACRLQTGYYNKFHCALFKRAGAAVRRCWAPVAGITRRPGTVGTGARVVYCSNTRYNCIGEHIRPVDMLYVRAFRPTNVYHVNYARAFLLPVLCGGSGGGGFFVCCRVTAHWAQTLRRPPGRGPVPVPVRFVHGWREISLKSPVACASLECERDVSRTGRARNRNVRCFPAVAGRQIDRIAIVILWQTNCTVLPTCAGTKLRSIAGEHRNPYTISGGMFASLAFAFAQVNMLTCTYACTRFIFRSYPCRTCAAHKRCE